MSLCLEWRVARVNITNEAPHSFVNHKRDFAFRFPSRLIAERCIIAAFRWRNYFSFCCRPHWRSSFYNLKKATSIVAVRVVKKRDVLCHISIMMMMMMMTMINIPSLRVFFMVSILSVFFFQNVAFFRAQ